jgi:hypothetical protein|tara:strand:- start:7320 stop:7508 length:189 start_codon:yes stop_codon:yes gene_type:complete
MGIIKDALQFIFSFIAAALLVALGTAILIFGGAIMSGLTLLAGLLFIIVIVAFVIKAALSGD